MFHSYRNKRVLITGHTGFKGSWLTLWLQRLGATVAGYALPPETKPAVFTLLNLKESIRHVEGDIRDYERLLTFVREFKPEVIFHLAAQAIVRDCYDDPKAAFDVNIGGTVNVLEAVRRTECVDQVVVVTSDKCYENLDQQIAFKETDRLGGRDPYSSSKAGAELVMHAYAQSYFNKPGAPAIASGRAGNVIGGGDWSNHRLLPDCVRALERGETLLIRSPHATRPWQHVLESLSGYLTLGEALALKPENHRGEAYNFGPPHEHHRTVAELLVTTQKHWPKLQWKIDPAAIGNKKESAYLRLDCGKARERLGWRPTATFEQAVEMSAEWYRANWNRTESMMKISEDQILKYAATNRE